MLKVIDVFKIGNGLSVTLDGDSDKISNGSQLIDSSGNTIIVKSVAMIRRIDPENAENNITIMIDECDIEVGNILTIA